jgi:biotin carboxyl carrier protein
VRYTVTLPSVDGAPPAIAEVDLVEGEAGTFQAVIDGRAVDLEVLRTGSSLTLRIDGQVADVVVSGRLPELALAGAGVRTELQVESERARSGSRAGAAAAPRDGTRVVKSPMPGRVVRVLVAAGAYVEAGQALLVLEAMKMENEVRAAIAGTVVDVAVSAGHAVESGARLMTLRASASPP